MQRYSVPDTLHVSDVEAASPPPSAQVSFGKKKLTGPFTNHDSFGSPYLFVIGAIRVAPLPWSDFKLRTDL